MASVKEEVNEEMESDIWLSNWANDENDEVKQEVDEKPNFSAIKLQVDESHDERTMPKLKKNNQITKLSVKARQATDKDGDNVTVKKSKENSKGKVVSGKRNNHSKSGHVHKSHNASPLQTALEQATCSENVANLCEYQCPKCIKKFCSRSTLSRHFRKTNHAIPTKGFFDNCLIKIVAHDCQICSKKLLCEIKVIENHLKSLHQIKTAKEYVQKTKVKLNDRVTQVKSNFDLFCSTITKAKKSVQMVGNLCTFSCSQCDFSCNSWHTMSDHIKASTHGPHKNPFMYATNATLHKCHICGELVLCEQVLIKNHVRNKHNITIKEYKKLIKFPNQEEMFKKYMSNLKIFIKCIPKVSNIFVWNMKPNSLPNHQLTNNIGNLSFFKCSLCEKSNMSYYGLNKHLNRLHKSNIIKSDKSHFHNVVEARYHECNICSRIILCDYGILNIHTKKFHKISVAQYAKDHVLKKGGQVYPTFRDFCMNPQVFETLKSDSESCINDNQDNSLILPSMISSESEDSDEEKT